MTKRRLVTLLGALLALVAISWWRLSAEAPDPGEPPTANLDAEEASAVETLGGVTMGTTFSVKYLPPGTSTRDVAQAAVQAALDEVVRSMSTYVSDSEISELNRTGADVAVPLSDGFAEVTALAIRINSKTMGAFDPTVRPLVGAFGFGSNAHDSRPTDEELETLRARVGMGFLVFDPDKRTLTKRIPEVELDFGGIAKGYGVDQVARALESLDIFDYMIEVGGEIRVRGEKAPATPWTLAIEEPLPDARRLHAILRLAPDGGALATSGDYRNFRESGGRVISHTFDPRTGEPVARRTASVSVVRPTAAEADALATALGVLTPEEALAVANQEGWAVYLLTHDPSNGFKPWSSQAFEELDFQEVTDN